MYCSSCGGAVAKGLSYCNHCGAKLGGAKDDAVAKPSESFPESLIWAIVAVFVVGLGITIGLMAMMKELLNFNTHLIILFASLCFLLTFGVLGVFIRLLFSHRSAAKEADDARQVTEQTTKELDAAQTRALPEPVPSVTERTTRTFEPIYSEPKSER